MANRARRHRQREVGHPHAQREHEEQQKPEPRVLPAADEDQQADARSGPTHGAATMPMVRPMKSAPSAPGGAAAQRMSAAGGWSW